MPKRPCTLLLDDLEHEAQKILNEARVYEISSYGWLNENDADPDYIGHAMWQTDQPALDFSAIFGDTPVRKRPADIEKIISTLGEDFCGLMQLSRLSIGLVLSWKQQAQQNFFHESTFFRLFHIDAYLKLAIASERLRDLLIVACTGDEPKKYRTTKQQRLYVTAFLDAGTLLTSRGLDISRLSDSLAALPDQANRIFQFVDKRNDIVHEITTPIAKSMQDSFGELQKKFDHEQKHGFKAREINFSEWNQATATLKDDWWRQIASSVHELTSWYQLLIDASNHVFQIEYWSRTLASQGSQM